MVAIEASASGSAGMISVIVPVYNGAKFIAAAIRSVLRQTLPPDEVIIVDDGSTDQSGDIAAGFEPKLRVLRQMHRGGAAALNAGIAVSRGELLAFLDADDLWSEGKLMQQEAALASNPSLDAVFGRVAQFTDLECRISEPAEITQTSESVVGHSKIAMLIRRAAFDRVGWFDEAIAIADFPDWYARAVRGGIRTVCPETVVAFRRVHRNNTSRLQRDALGRDYLRIVRTLVSRRELGVNDGS